MVSQQDIRLWIKFWYINKTGFSSISRIDIAAIYFVVFYFAIKKFNLPTPGREEDDDEDILDEVVEDDSQLGKVHSKASPIEEKAALVLEALGGSSNIENKMLV
ncbi:PTS system glucose-like transporter subunit IIB [Clostridium baratii]|nr:PTS system glucose-like transporter subunit IIB [Clostridium baratii]